MRRWGATPGASLSSGQNYTSGAWYVPTLLNGKYVDMLLDTGSSNTIIPYELFLQCKGNRESVSETVSLQTASVLICRDGPP